MNHLPWLEGTGGDPCLVTFTFPDASGATTNGASGAPTPVASGAPTPVASGAPTAGASGATILTVAEDTGPVGLSSNFPAFPS